MAQIPMPDSFIQLFRFAFEFAIDTLFPPDPFVRQIERMTPEEFSREALHVDEIDQIDGTIAFFSYRDALVKTAVLEVKSYANKKVARLIGRAAYELLVPELSDLETFRNFKDPLLIPIPLTKRARRSRGWNQCELIASEISKATSLSLEYRPDILIKSKETEDQVGKSKSERFKNLKGCFSVRDKEKILGKNVIILDDIVTTGATLKEAKKAVLDAGARRALCIAIAH
jgi:competence protein ComFC